MGEIKFTELKCQRCGGELLELANDTYECESCNKKWQKQTMHNFTNMLEACEQAARNQRVSDIANLRRLLWKETHKEYVSNIKVAELCRDILKYLPDDFYANFYLATCGKDKTELGSFLFSVNIEERYDDVPLVLDYVLTALRPEWTMDVSNFIERIKDADLDLYHTCRTKFEEEYEKIEECIFEPTLPRDVFIAYSSKDIVKVAELVSALEDEQLTCFVAARNMRHGSGSVEKYEETIHTAIDNCSVIVFVSSDNSRSVRCDAYRELDYINKTCKNKPRVELVIKNYSGRATERFFEAFFRGLEYCTSVKDAVERVADIIMSGDSAPDNDALKEELERKKRQKLEEEHKKAQELEQKIALAERARLEAENKRREEDEAARKQAEKERKHKEEQERLRREEAAAAAAEAERRRKADEERRKIRQAEEDYNEGKTFYDNKNYEEAVKWFKKSAEQGNASAQFKLGVCYDYGRGVTQDYDEAVKCYREAAEQGNASAQNNLGWCYKNGQGVTQNYDEAVKLYRKSAEQGNASAQCNLGNCYFNGQGVNQNYEEAVKWYRKAAEQGESDAQNNLGVCYKNGQGVAQNFDEAIKWYRKAGEQGNKTAQQNLKRLGGSR